MKKSFKLLAFMAMAMLIIVSACKKDDDDDNGGNTPADENPVLNFLVEAGFVSADVTVNVGDSIKTKIYMAENPTTKKNIDKLNWRRIWNNTTFDNGTIDIGKKEETLILSFKAQMTEGSETFEFEAVDNNGKKTTISFVVTTLAPGGPINTFTMKILGSYNSATGSSFASISGDVYGGMDAKNNAAVIDFMYWWGGSTDATIGAPDDANAALVFTNPTYGLGTWAVKNATRFQTTIITAGEFDQISNDIEIILAATGSSETRIPNLQVGDVIALVTVTGKMGLIKVTAINPGDAGDITIDVKVQQ